MVSKVCHMYKHITNVFIESLCVACEDYECLVRIELCLWLCCNLKWGSLLLRVLLLHILQTLKEIQSLQAYFMFVKCSIASFKIFCHSHVHLTIDQLLHAATALWEWDAKLQQVLDQCRTEEEVLTETEVFKFERRIEPSWQTCLSLLYVLYAPVCHWSVEGCGTRLK